MKFDHFRTLILIEDEGFILRFLFSNHPLNLNYLLRIPNLHLVYHLVDFQLILHHFFKLQALYHLKFLKKALQGLFFIIYCQIRSIYLKFSFLRLILFLNRRFFFKILRVSFGLLKFRHRRYIYLLVAIIIINFHFIHKIDDTFIVVSIIINLHLIHKIDDVFILVWIIINLLIVLDYFDSYLSFLFLFIVSIVRLGE